MKSIISFKEKNELILAASKEATRKALKGRISDFKIEYFLDTLGSEHVPKPIFATGAIFGAGIFDIECHPQAAYHWKHAAYGAGVAVGTAEGLLYTAYTSWDLLWENTTSCWAQGIAEEGGIFQITFFDDKHTPVGQFTAVFEGISVFEIGSGGHWHKNK